MARRPKVDPQKAALDESRLTLDDLATAAGMSRSALEKYRLTGENRLPMPPAIARRLAAFLRSHAEKLSQLATDLDQSAEGRERG